MTTTSLGRPQALVGHRVFDPDGVELGEIVGVYLDRADREPEWAALRVAGGEIIVVPLAEAEIYEDSVDIPFPTNQVDNAPYRRRRFARELSEEEEAALYRHYGWGDENDTVHEVTSAAKGQAQEVAGAAKERGQEVASAAKERSLQLGRTTGQVGEVAGSAKGQAAQVTQEASAQARGLLEETRSRLEEQAATGAARAAERLRGLGEEAQALAEGRPEEATTLRGYVQRAADSLRDGAERIDGMAEAVESRGLAGLLEDLQDLARRRPGAFVVGTTAAGLAVGRLVGGAKDDTAAEESAPPPARRPVTAGGQRRSGSGGRR